VHCQHNREALLDVISHALPKDRVEAAKSFVMLDFAVFKAEIETGMFKKLARGDRQGNPLRSIAGRCPDGHHRRAARGRMLPSETVESMVRHRPK
jgi:hypothetical protein